MIGTWQMPNIFWRVHSFIHSIMCQQPLASMRVYVENAKLFSSLLMKHIRRRLITIIAFAQPFYFKAKTTEWCSVKCEQFSFVIEEKRSKFLVLASICFSTQMCIWWHRLIEKKLEKKKQKLKKWYEIHHEKPEINTRYLTHFTNIRTRSRDREMHICMMYILSGIEND